MSIGVLSQRAATSYLKLRMLDYDPGIVGVCLLSPDLRPEIRTVAEAMLAASIYVPKPEDSISAAARLCLHSIAQNNRN